jgi:hypothetical protein
VNLFRGTTALLLQHLRYLQVLEHSVTAERNHGKGHTLAAEVVSAEAEEEVHILPAQAGWVHTQGGLLNATTETVHPTTISHIGMASEMMRKNAM